MDGYHDEEVEDGDDEAGHLQGLGREHEAEVELDVVHHGQVGAEDELEALQEGRERVRDHQGEDEGDVGTGHLRVGRSRVVVFSSRTWYGFFSLLPEGKITEKLVQITRDTLAFLSTNRPFFKPGANVFSNYNRRVVLVK